VAKSKAKQLALALTLFFAAVLHPASLAIDHSGPRPAVTEVGPSIAHASSGETIQGEVRYRIRSPAAYATGFGAALVLGTYGTYELLSQHPDLLPHDPTIGETPDSEATDIPPLDYAELGIIGYYDATISFILEDVSGDEYRLERGTIRWEGYNLCELSTEHTDQVIGLELTRPLQMIISDSFGDSGSRPLDPAKDQIELRLVQNPDAPPGETFEHLEYELDLSVNPPYTVSGRSEFVPYFPSLTFRIEATDGKVTVKSPWHTSDTTDLSDDFSIEHFVRDLWSNRQSHIETWQGPLGTHVVVETTIDYACKPQIHITTPESPYSHTEILTYDEAVPGVLQFTAEAKTRDTWSDALDDLVWTFPEIEGSDLTTDPEDKRGRRIEVTYTGLPADNAQFGRKEIIAEFETETLCDDPPPAKVGFFYDRDAENNPDGDVPNWFYYWSQTSAAQALPDFVSMRYDPAGGGRDEDDWLLGYYTWGETPYSDAAHTFFICPPACEADVRIWPGRPDLTDPTDGIDTFARVVLHELQHLLDYHEWWAAGDDPEEWGYEWHYDEDKDEMVVTDPRDRDGDRMPDLIEPSHGCDPTKYSTFGRMVGRDSEVTARRAEWNWLIGSADGEDWANPGKNSGGAN